MMELIGYIAAILTTSAFVPQIIYVVKTKSSQDISLRMYLILCIGTIMWSTYGFLIQSYPVIIANLITLVFVCIILFYKVRELRKK